MSEHLELVLEILVVFNDFVSILQFHECLLLLADKCFLSESLHLFNNGALNIDGLASAEPPQVLLQPSVHEIVLCVIL